jgi:hypothetical protein
MLFSPTIRGILEDYVTSKTITGTYVAGYSVTVDTLFNQGLFTGGAAIDGLQTALYNKNFATIVNSGTISNTVSVLFMMTRAVVFDAGGVVTNQPGGVISGNTDGVYMTGGAGAVVNAGTITSERFSSATYGVDLRSGGIIINQAGGSISGEFGVLVKGGAGTVVNAGTIGQALYSGVRLLSTGDVTNQYHGAISGGTQGIVIAGGEGSVANAGQIAGGASGVVLGYGGSLTNASGATVTGGRFGIYIGSDPGTVTNSGDIVATLVSGGAPPVAVELNAGGSVSNTASGTIVGRVGVDLPGGGALTNAGTIIGTGGTAVSFGGSGANWLTVDPGAEFSGVVSGGANASNTLELAAGATAGTLIGLGTQFVNFGSIVFDPGAQWSIAANPAGLAGVISGFVAGDTIEVTGLADTIASYGGGILSLGGQQPLVLNLSGAIEPGMPNGGFVATPGPDGTDISLACFAEGTRIRTERGAVAVEALRVGDRVPVLMGGGAKPVVWLGHRRVICKGHPNPTHVWPIRVAAGAFGPGRPFRDLVLSPDHALFIQGVLIPVRYLVNGQTIYQEACDVVTYWHVELAQHDVLYAEGVPAESYLDTGNRGSFANGGPTLRLYPEFARNVWEANGCAPLVVCGPRVATAKRRLLARASALGHATADDANLIVQANGRTLTTATDGRTWHVRLPKAAKNARLISRRWTPANMRPDSDDPRTLGVSISRIWLDRCAVALDSPVLSSGWHVEEPDWRWTDGDALIEFDGARELSFEMAMIGTYWADEATQAHRAA